MKLFPENAWLPSGVEGLEPNALSVVKSTGNALVVAGPGAGKTELLAQRANFLLTTGRSRSPKRILALAFKKDAAHNLEARVESRCGEFARRFDSLTIDAFAKKIVDRFLASLPEKWRPHESFEIRLKPLGPQEIPRWLSESCTQLSRDPLKFEQMSKDDLRRLMDLVSHGHRLPHGITSNLEQALGDLWWHQQVRQEPGNPSLTFPMVCRLAAYLLRANPVILKAMRMTYSHAFLDEFQDTTASQWDLVSTALAGSDVSVTAVGDAKQRIMVWAGAQTNIFEVFQKDFNAQQIDLVSNYRSAPYLVKIQHAIAQELEESCVEPIAASKRAGRGICQIIEFRNPEQEAEYLAAFVDSAIRNEGGAHRDFCVLARQQPDVMISLLKSSLSSRGIAHRDESSLQDLKAEPLFQLCLSALLLATRRRDPQAWIGLRSQLLEISGLDEELDGQEIERLCVQHKQAALTLIKT